MEKTATARNCRSPGGPLKTIISALLLALSMSASASCFVHPDTRITYCTSAAECPPSTSWSASTQACAQAAAIATAPTPGAYMPIALHTANVASLVIRKAIWSRNGNAVTVSGAYQFQPRTAGYARVILELPIPAIFGSAFDLSGTTTTGNGLAGTVRAAGNAADVSILMPDTAVETVQYIYAYEAQP